MGNSTLKSTLLYPNTIKILIIIKIIGTNISANLAITSIPLEAIYTQLIIRTTVVIMGFVSGINDDLIIWIDI
jgi:hypothetical protein